MINISHTNRFKKDFDLVKRRGKDFNKFKKVLDLLITNINEDMANSILILPQKYRLHRLASKYSESWKCHIEPDWLLIFYFNDKNLILERTGTHSDSFK